MFTDKVMTETWIVALISSASIGIASLLPWLFNMNFFEQHNHKKMGLMLSFAVGSILGDIFFHLIPESTQAHMSELRTTRGEALRKIGISVIHGIFLFIIVERVIESGSNTQIFKSEKDTKNDNKKVRQNEKCSTDLKEEYQHTQIKSIKHIISDENNNNNNNNNNNEDSSNFEVNYNDKLSLIGKSEKIRLRKQSSKHDLDFWQHNTQMASEDKPAFKNDSNDKNKVIDTAGYLNLIANGFDNFTHGLAIGASFLASQKVGLLSTFVVLIHEIPHEICDYAILVKSGFTRLDAVKAQSFTSVFGVLGTATALWMQSALKSQTLWILPFSAGGFLHIALANLMTGILTQDKQQIHDKKIDMLKQIGCVTTGIAFMALVALL